MGAPVERSADAWILALGADRHAAVGITEVLHILAYSPVLFRVPQAPPHCRSVILWEDRVVPVVDLRALITGGADAVGSAGVAGLEQLVAIVAYQSDSSQPAEFGALLLAGLPIRATVTDADACEPDTGVVAWARFASACFRHSSYGAIPVLDLGRVFRPPAAQA